MRGKTILVVEDEADIRDLIVYHLSKEKYQILEAEDGEVAIQKSLKQIPDLILLDLMLPKKDGFEVTSTLKNNALTKYIPIIMVTAKGEEEDIIRGLQRGADDYITKPFSPKVLSARIKNIWRQKYLLDNQQGSTFQFNQLYIDYTKKVALLEDELLKLTPLEFEILIQLCQSPISILTIQALIQNTFETEVNIRQSIQTLKGKMKTYGDRIIWEKGLGLRLIIDNPEELP